jgi:hypothetical protein
MAVSLAGAVAIQVAEAVISPPTRLPYLWLLANCAYSFVHFVGFFVYFHFRQYACMARSEGAAPVHSKQE